MLVKIFKDTIMKLDLLNIFHFNFEKEPVSIRPHMLVRAFQDTLINLDNPNLKDLSKLIDIGHFT